MFAILVPLILRPVGFKFRSKSDDPRWRARWDWALFVGGLVPALIFGVAIGNVLQGVPFRLAPDMRIFYEGTFFGLLNPFALLCGVVSRRDAGDARRAWLLLKTQGPVADRARAYGSVAALLTLVLYALAGYVLWSGIDGYRVTSALPTGGPSNPLLKMAEMQPGAWFANYAAWPWMWRRRGWGWPARCWPSSGCACGAR